VRQFTSLEQARIAGARLNVVKERNRSRAGRTNFQFPMVVRSPSSSQEHGRGQGGNQPGCSGVLETR
jgi:hypothetical protein